MKFKETLVEQQNTDKIFKTHALLLPTSDIIKSTKLHSILQDLEENSNNSANERKDNKIERMKLKIKNMKEV